MHNVSNVLATHPMVPIEFGKHRRKRKVPSFDKPNTARVCDINREVDVQAAWLTNILNK
jgi:hypothetical protein